MTSFAKTQSPNGSEVSPVANFRFGEIGATEEIVTVLHTPTDNQKQITSQHNNICFDMIQDTQRTGTHTSLNIMCTTRMQARDEADDNKENLVLYNVSEEEEDELSEQEADMEVEEETTLPVCFSCDEPQGEYQCTQCCEYMCRICIMFHDNKDCNDCDNDTDITFMYQGEEWDLDEICNEDEEMESSDTGYNADFRDSDYDDENAEEDECLANMEYSASDLFLMAMKRSNEYQIARSFTRVTERMRAMLEGSRFAEEEITLASEEEIIEMSDDDAQEAIISVCMDVLCEYDDAELQHELELILGVYVDYLRAF